MKKPKKTTAAKPPVARTISSQSKAEADAAKLEAAEAREKSEAKTARKTRTKAPESAAKVEASEETKAPSVLKPRAKRKNAPTAEPAKQTASQASQRAEAKAETTIKPAAIKKPLATPKAPVWPAVKPAPAAEAKPSRRKIQAAPKVAALGPAKVEAKIEVPAKEAKPVEPFKKEMAEIPPVASSKPISAAQQTVKLRVAASEKKVSEAEAPAAKPILPVFSPPIKQAVRKAPEKIPPILLEGDKPEAKSVSGPGRRYALGPTAPAKTFQTEGELPESYGTGELLLTARDPHWLYAHWDLAGDQQRRYNAFSRDGHLVVRVYIDETRGKPAVQVQVHPESNHWFVHVDKANTRYVAELGYYSKADEWMVVATSASTLTPPDAVSAETTAEFGTIPFEVPMEKLLSLVKEAVHENAPLAQTLQELRAEGHSDLPPMPAQAPTTYHAPRTNGHSGQVARGGSAVKAGAGTKRVSRWTPSEWTPAQERALAEVISMDHVRRVWMGSLEITELIRRQFVNELASMSAADLGAPAPT